MNAQCKRHPPRLILVDGLAGAGKSTTAQRLWIQLRNTGHEAIWFHEHDSRHPIFYFSTLEELPRLVTESLWDEIIANWKRLARSGSAGPIRVLEGSLFQTSVGVLLSQNVGADRIKAMVLMVADVIRELGAAVIYLRFQDTSMWLSQNMRNRGQNWVDRMTGILAQTPYGRQYPTQDVGMLLEFFRQQQHIIDAMFTELPLEKTAIDVGDRNWAKSYGEMVEFLGIGSLVSLDTSNGQLGRFVGAFRGESTGTECVVGAESESLFMRFANVEPAWRLLPVVRDSGEFCVQSLPVTIQFDFDGIDKVRGFACDVRVPEFRLTDITWRRVG